MSSEPALEKHITTCRPEWLWVVLPFAPWVAMNRGVHRFGWVTAILIGFPVILGVMAWETAEEFYLDMFFLFGIGLYLVFYALLLALILTPLCPEDQTAFRALGITLKRVLLLVPYFALLAYVVEGLCDLAIAACLPEPSQDADMSQWLYQERPIAYAFKDLLMLSLYIYGTAATLLAARPGWSSRWPATCEGCAYTLLGLPADASCPECGKPLVESLAYRHRCGPEARWPSPWRRSLAAFFFPKTFGSTIVTRSPYRGFRPVLMAITLGVLMTAYLNLAASLEAHRNPYSYQYTFHQAGFSDFLLLHLANDWMTLEHLAYLVLNAIRNGASTVLSYAMCVCAAAALAIWGGPKRGPSPVFQGLLHLGPLLLLFFVLGLLVLIWGEYFENRYPSSTPIFMIAGWFGWTPSPDWRDMIEIAPALICLSIALLLWGWLYSSLRQIASAASKANW
ncbi:hypothetical protein [Mucisphaera calidilacus]|uniref:Uncharacterized protein n=1 Tax=Mucisphaera calidilacus TaxID=2527982 RepID=A0A518BZF4_9BACT|nr:hypothetical protein [Mucisphaera calidilacus]QDU72356.1 hypothetical protein Pan265_22210 [Mucisphaera calidilacus]